MLDFLFNINPLDFIQVDILDFIGNLRDKISGNSGAAINSYMIDLCNKNLLGYGIKMSEKLISTARYLGAIFAICVAAGQAYKVMANGDRFDVLGIMRPLIFAFVLSFWPAICTTLMMPGQYVESYMSNQYVAVAENMENLRRVRLDKARVVNEHVTAAKFNADKAKESSEGFSFDLFGLGDAIEDGIDWVKNMGTKYLNLAGIWIFSIIETVLQCIGEMVFAVCVYIVFLCKALYLTVLMMFGPIYMVCSILDVWKNSWSEWVGRMVSVSFYGAMAYLVMTFSCVLITMTIQADIDKLSEIANNPAMGMASYMSGHFGTTIMTFVGYLVGALAMGTVFELATFVFPGGALMGANSFIGGMKGYATKYTGTKSLFAK